MTDNDDLNRCPHCGQIEYVDRHGDCRSPECMGTRADNAELQMGDR